MRMNSIVSEKGQITIPKKLRTRLGLSAGVILEVHEDHGKLIIEKKSSKSPFDQWYGKGHLPFGKNTNDYLNTVRDI